MTDVNKAGNPAAEAAKAEVQMDTDNQPKAATENHSEVNERLLRESREWKSKYQASIRKLEEIESAKKQEAGEYKELYEKERSRFEGLMKELVTKEMKSAVKDAATRAGAVDVDAVFVLGDHNLLKFDSETKEVVGADLFVDGVKKNKSYLFQSAKANTVNPVTPGGVGNKQLTPTDVAKQTADKKSKLWADAFKSSGI